MKSKQKYLVNEISILSLMFSSLLTTTSALAWTTVESGLTSPKEGMVIDSHTGKPIPNAWVVVRWLNGGYGFLGHAVSQTGCLYSLTLRTDENGIYRIPEVSEHVEVERSWSLVSKDGYGWSLIVFVPGYITSSDYPAWQGIQKDHYTEEETKLLASNLSPDPWSHPKVLSGGWFGSKQMLEPVKVERSKLPSRAEAWYLFGLQQAGECYRFSADIALLNALYQRAYQVACTNSPTAEGAGLGLVNLWESVVLTAKKSDSREEAMSGIRNRAYRNQGIYSQEDRKAMCELMKPIEGE